MSKPSNYDHLFNEKLIKRFWDYVNKTNNCWLWEAGCFDNGYGQFRAGDKKVKAHRYSYEIAYGKIPKDLNVCHKCDNQKCVNPKHLFIGTHKDNAMDSVKKGRRAFGLFNGAHTHPEKRSPGEKNGSSKLISSEVIKMRKLRKEGLTYRELAQLFKISISQTQNIVKNRSWRYLNANQNPLVR